MSDSPRTIEHSAEAFERARRVMPGGVSSPVRAYQAVGGTPLFIKQAQGPYVIDADGNRYIDYVMSYGPLILGHSHEQVVAALSRAVGRGTSYGAPTELETELAEKIIAAMPAVEMLRFVNSGTEAAMAALRLARAATKRELVVKCAGCYHGHVDGLLVEAGSGALTLGTPSSPGVPSAVASLTLVIPYNDLPAAEQAFQQHGERIACFAVEPVAGNMGLVPPADGYLQGLRELCDRHGALLLFDEVMTGFRVGLGGASVRFGVKPDLVCLGKIIGGGLPVGAYGGRRDLMEQVAPSGPVYQAGTLSGNPLAMSAGLATLEVCSETDFYDKLEKRSIALADGLRQAASAAGVPVTVQQLGAMICVFFTRVAGRPVRNHADATACDTARFARFFHAMLDHGVFLPPSQFECWFPSLAHDEDAIEQTLLAATEAFVSVAAGS
jgi:glutamate-1-semialdehyde 2,1-aminomutase